MAGTQNLSLDEVQLIQLILQNKILTEGQIKASYDYQRSVGGSIIDILVKLGMLRRNQLDSLVDAALNGEDVSDAVKKRSTALGASEVDVTSLKIHHRILDKLAASLVEEFLIVIFFPSANLDSRKLIVGHGKKLPVDVQAKVRSAIGVDLSTLELSEGAAASFLVPYMSRKGRTIPGWLQTLADADQPDQETGDQSGDNVEDPLTSESVNENEETLNLGEKPNAGVEADPDHDVPVVESSPESSESNPDSTTDDTGSSNGLLQELPSRGARDASDSVPPVGDCTKPPAERDELSEDGTTQDTNRGLVEKMTPRERGGGKSDPFAEGLAWEALLNLLVKKKVIDREELEVEKELVKRRASRP